MSDLPASLANSILRTAATWRWMSIGLLILCIVLSIAIAVMMPLKSIQVEYVEFSSSGNNFVTVRSAGTDLDLQDVINDISLRAYVVMREGVDQVTEKERYECVLSMSSDTVSELFRTLYIKRPETSADRTPLARIEGFKREIRLGADYPIGTYKHRIEFTTVDTTDSDEIGDAPDTNNWVAIIQYKKTDRKISLERLKTAIGEEGAVCNPIGIEIEDYTLRKMRK